MVASLVTLYKKLKFVTDENVGWGPIDLPEIELQTTAYWLTADALPTRWRRNELDVALMGAGRAIQTIAAVLLMVDPRDLGLVAQVRSPHHEAPTIYLYEAVPGGIGLSRAALGAPRRADRRRRGPHPRLRLRRRAARPAPGRGSSRTSTREALALRLLAELAGRAVSPTVGGRGMSAGTLERRLANYRAALRPDRDADGPATRRTTARARLDRARRAARRRPSTASCSSTRRARRPLRAGDRRPAARPRARSPGCPGQPPPDAPLVCLDTETTGLATAAGTMAFLVGLGWWEGDRFRQAQLLLPDQPDEPAMLAPVDGPHPGRRLARDVQRPRLRLAAARRPATGWPACPRRPTPATSTCCRSSAACSATGWPTRGCGPSRRSCSGRAPRGRRGLADPRPVPRLPPRRRRVEPLDRRRPPQPRGRPLARPAAGRIDVELRRRRPNAARQPIGRPRRARPGVRAGAAGSTRRWPASTRRSTRRPAAQTRPAVAVREEAVDARAVGRPGRGCRGGTRRRAPDIGGRSRRPTLGAAS